MKLLLVNIKYERFVLNILRITYMLMCAHNLLPLSMGTNIAKTKKKKSAHAHTHTYEIFYRLPSSTGMS